MKAFVMPGSVVCGTCGWVMHIAHQAERSITKCLNQECEHYDQPFQTPFITVDLREPPQTGFCT